MEITLAQQRALVYLENDLPQDLYYHGPHHTWEVYQAAQEIGRHERVSTWEMGLLETAALFHDLGFSRTYHGHEAAGAEIVQQELPRLGYSRREVSRIAQMILATKLPQSPKDPLGRILCDADLFYLGRDDYHQVADTLYQELLSRKLLAPDPGSWQAMQVNFLQSHQYFTPTARRLRDPGKWRHLREVQAGMGLQSAAA